MSRNSQAPWCKGFRWQDNQQIQNEILIVLQIYYLTEINIWQSLALIFVPADSEFEIKL